MRQLGLILMIFASFIFLLGLLFLLLPSFPRLPGDILIKKKGVTIFIPLGTSILLSILLTLVLNLIFKGK